MKRSDERPGQAAVSAAAASISGLTQPIFAHLGLWASEVAQLNLAGALAEGHLDHAELARLEAEAVRIIRSADLVTGAGMATASASPSGRGLMHWWILRDDEVVTKRHVFNPQSDSYYDFSNSRWFRMPVQRSAATLIAPYVDSWGTDDLTITASFPVEIRGSDSPTVVAVDLNARAYVEAAEQMLRSVAPAVLIDGEGRAVASTQPDIETGVRLAALKSWQPVHAADVSQVGWAVTQIGLHAE